MKTDSAANPTSIDPRAIASAVTPIRSELAGKNFRQNRDRDRRPFPWRFWA